MVSVIAFTSLKLSEAFNEAAAKAATMATASIAIPPQPGTAVSGALRRHRPDVFERYDGEFVEGDVREAGLHLGRK